VVAVYLTAWSRHRLEKIRVNEIIKKERRKDERKGMEGKVEKRNGEKKGRK
jgi:hypothetical protein